MGWPNGSGAHIQAHHAVFGEGVGVKHEILVLFQQRGLAAARDEAFTPPLGAGPEAAQPAEIAVGAGLDQEDVHLVMGDADGMVGEQLRKRSVARPIQGGEIVGVVHPDRQIHVLAVVQHLPTAPRDLGFEGLGHRAEQGYGRDLRHMAESGRHGLGRAPKILMRQPREMVFLGNPLDKRSPPHAGLSLSGAPRA